MVTTIFYENKFIIPVSDTQAYKQFGNSVAVPAVSAVAQSMIAFMEKTKMLDIEGAGGVTVQ